MKISISTPVGQSMEKVWKGFDERLFGALAPPFPPVKVLFFGGCMAGNVVSLELNFIFFKQQWTSIIIEQKTTSNEIYFVDKGTKLPFFLRFWQHKHRIVKAEAGSVIIDEITYQSPFKVTDYILFPLMFLQFLYRKPIYKKIFSVKA